MNILGTIYMMDEPRLDVLRGWLNTTPPPMGNMATGTMICMDMDETDNKLEVEFPDHCQKATLLCPPPLAMYKEIDGDEEGFIQAYNEYLDYDSSVQDFIASMLMYLHMGGHIFMYSPSYIDDCPIWLNTLMLFFFTRYGITIGTSESNGSMYDQRYDGVIADLLYRKGFMNVFDYINSNTSNILDSDIEEKVCLDLEPFTPIGEHPLEMYRYMKDSLLKYGLPIIKPAVIFERY